jgi:hypothetical protein
MKKSSFWAVILSFLIISSCNKCNDENKDLKVDVSKVEVHDVKIHRYEKALAKVNPKTIKEDLAALRNEYRFFLDGDLNDPSNLQQMKNFISDPLFTELYNDGMKFYPELSDIEKQLTEAFKHYKYYYSKSRIPEVYTYVSIFDFESPIKYSGDSVLIIALDMYFGNKYKNYGQLMLPDGTVGIPTFKSFTYKKDFIVPDCMREIAKTKLDYNKSCKTFLEEMIYQGKILYFVDAMIPDADDTLKIGFPSAKLDWCKKNESNVWAFFIDKKLLYSTDQHKYSKFLTDGPFTSAFGKDSPARIGAWIGWQIVKKYMRSNNQVNMTRLMEDYDAQQILSQSAYKPRK